MFREMKDIIKKFKLNQWYYKRLNIEYYSFYDLRPLYKSFIKKEVLENPQLNDLEDCFEAQFSFLIDDNIDVYYIKTINKCKNGICLFPHSDGICDIKVPGATFARLTVSDPFILNHPIEMTKNNQGNFELPEVTIETPIFTEKTGSRIRIETDGNIVYYTFIRMSYEKFKLMEQFSNHTVSWLPNKNIVMTGNQFALGIIANEKDFIKIHSFTYKLYYLFCKSLYKKLNYKIINKLIKY